MEAAPVDAAYALELAAVKEGGCHGLGFYGSAAGDAWEKGFGAGICQLCKWSRLRRAVLDGCSLRLTVIVLGGSEAAATLNTALRIQSNASDTLPTIGALLDGPFTDVAVTAGGRTFRAHRVVLAAASPVFLGMLDGDMREAREAAVELVGADAGAVELLLRHLYSNPIEVPVSVALQLYTLADQYQVAAGLQQRLRLWLMALQLAPEVLCELAPAARTLCPSAFLGGLRWQAADEIEQLSPLPAFAGWPLDAVVEVMEEAEPLHAFNAAVAWMGAQPQPAERQDSWPRLLDAVPWARASSSDLRAMQRHRSAGQVPGLQGRVVEAALHWGEDLATKNRQLKDQHRELKEQVRRLQQQQQQMQQQMGQMQQQMQRQQQLEWGQLEVVEEEESSVEEEAEEEAEEEEEEEEQPPQRAVRQRTQ